jgi:uncharacterized protein (TIGR03382 family)
MLRSSIVSLTAATLLIQGCDQSGPAEPLMPGVEALDLRQPELVEAAARNSDPLSMLLFATLPIVAHEASDPEGRPDCPRVIDKSDRAAGIVDWRMEGGCEWEDDEGRHRVEGSIVAVGDENGTELEYHGYRITTVPTLDCAGQEIGMAMTGVVRFPFAYLPLTPEDDENPGEPPTGDVVAHYEIDIHLESSELGEACLIERLDLAYDVTIDRTLAFSDTGTDESDLSDVRGRAALLTQTRQSAGEPWQTALSGAWSVTAEGYGAAAGDATCGDYITGTLRIEAGGDVAVLQPEPPLSCLDDDDASERVCTAWSLNGERQPELCNFVGLSGCSAGPNAPPPWAAMVILLAGLVWQQRRARRTRA